MLIFNKATGVGADPVVRQAIQAVINCGDLLHAAYGSEYLYNLYSSYMFKDSATWYTEAGSDKYNQADPEAAKALFAQAGWTDSNVFRILVNNSSSGYVAEALVIQEELRAIGVNCEVLSYDSATYSDVRNNHTENWDAFITGFGPKVLPNMNLYLSTGWPAEGTGCTDERVQGDLAAIASGADLDRAEHLGRAAALHVRGVRPRGKIRLHLPERRVPLRHHRRVHQGAPGMDRRPPGGLIRD